MKKTKLDPALKRTFSYLKPFKKEFALVAVALLVSTAVGFLQPLAIRSITDEGMLQQNMGMIVRSVLVLAVLVLINQSLDLCGNQSHPRLRSPLLDRIAGVVESRRKLFSESSYIRE